MSSHSFAAARQHMLALSIPSNVIGHPILVQALTQSLDNPLQLSSGQIWNTVSRFSGRSKDQLRASAKRALAYARNRQMLARVVGTQLSNVDPTRFLFSSYWFLTGNRLPLLFPLQGALTYGDVSLLLLRKTHSFSQIAYLWKTSCSVLEHRYEKKQPIAMRLLQEQKAGRPFPYLMYQYCVDDAQLALLEKAFGAGIPSNFAPDGIGRLRS